MTEQLHTPLGEPVELLRSEEQLRASTTRVPVQRARLEKFEVTEMKTITVPVIREDVRIVYEPVEPGVQVPDSQSATLRPWVLTEERVVVTKERVPVEKVRMVVETVTEQRDVTGEVRKEQITLASIPTSADAR